MLPPICTRWDLDGRVTEIPRESALVFEGTAFFSLCKGQGRDYDCNFGCLGITFFPYRRIDKDMGILLTLLPELFRLLDQGIPESWARTKGFVTKHVFVSGARDSLGNAFIP